MSSLELKERELPKSGCGAETASLKSRVLS